MRRIGIVAFSLGAAVISIAGLSGFAADDEAEKPAVKIDSPADAARKKALIADADSALKLLTSKKFHEFIETYGPVDDLRRIRANDSFKEVAQSFVFQPERMATLVKLLRGIKSGNITFQAHGSEATIELTDKDAAAIAASASAKKVAVKVAVPVAVTKGLGGDLSEVLKAASKLLEDGNTAEFVASVYPQPMLEQMDLAFRRDAVVNDLHENKDVLAALASDFAAMQKVEPELTENDKVAVFKLKPPAADNEGDDDSRKPAKPARERLIKLQLVEGNWRFFDSSRKATEILTELANAKSAAAPPTIRMEKIGGNWRFITFEGLGF